MNLGESMKFWAYAPRTQRLSRKTLMMRHSVEQKLHFETVEDHFPVEDFHHPSETALALVLQTEVAEDLEFSTVNSNTR